MCVCVRVYILSPYNEHEKLLKLCKLRRITFDNDIDTVVENEKKLSGLEYPRGYTKYKFLLTLNACNIFTIIEYNQWYTI